MTANATVNLLHRVEIFSDLPEDLLEKLANNLKRIYFEAETEIICKGDPGESMFVIESGKVRIHDGSHTVATMNEGNFFGEFSLLDDAPRSMSVTAIENVSLLIIEQALFYELLQTHSEVTKKIISALTKRLRRQNESIILQLKTREAELTRLVDERTRELRLRNEEITIKNKEITDNVSYAKRIQTAILPDEKRIKNAFNESFVLYLPKDIVSGDFYSFFETVHSKILIAADCTGHGVTGAMLSVVGSSLLNKIINEKAVSDPGKILDSLNEEIISTLNQHNGELTDGMDIIICMFEKSGTTLKYAGANRPLWLLRNNELNIFQPDKLPVGGNQILVQSNFQSNEIEVMANDSIYIFTDGFADQFGGEAGKKLMTKKFKEILLSINNLSMAEQKKELLSAFEKWKGNNEQVDDVLVMGIRIIV